MVKPDTPRGRTKLFDVRENLSTWVGSVLSIHITAVGCGPMAAVTEARAVPGRGLEGDRYFLGTGSFSKRPRPGREITLIEIEALQALARECGIDLEPGQARRNLVTVGVPLNHLVGKEFRVGAITLAGVRLCEPCGLLEELVGRRVKPGLLHRGGLRAAILTEGILRQGDPIHPSITPTRLERL